MVTFAQMTRSLRLRKYMDMTQVSRFCATLVLKKMSNIGYIAKPFSGPMGPKAARIGACSYFFATSWYWCVVVGGLFLLACDSETTNGTPDSHGGDVTTADTTDTADNGADVGSDGAILSDVESNDANDVDVAPPVDVPSHDDPPAPDSGGTDATSGDVPSPADVSTPDADPTDASTPTDLTTEDTVDAIIPPKGPAGPCPLNEKVGTFEIADFTIYAAVTGSVRTGVIPLTILQKQAESGDCTLLKKENYFCNPGCNPGDLCNVDGTCIPYPLNLDLGTVTVVGLKVPVSMKPNPNNDYFDTELPPNPWDPYAQVTLSTEGKDLAPFELQVEGVKPLSGVNPKWTVNAGQSTEITWTPADGPGHIYITLNIDQHGATPVTLFCQTQDTGNLSVDAALINQFIEFGVSGFAVGEVYRRSVDSVTIEPGCVELSLFSRVKTQPVVEGHTPCNSNADCPTGQKCNIFINTCVDK